VTNPLTVTAVCTYDRAGHPLVIADAQGLTTSLKYDAAYQLGRITYHDGGSTPNVSFDYDSLGRRPA